MGTRRVIPRCTAACLLYTSDAADDLLSRRQRQMCIRDRETVVPEDIAETIIDKVVKEITTGNYGDGKIFIYDVQDAVRIRTGERGVEAL